MRAWVLAAAAAMGLAGQAGAATYELEYLTWKHRVVDIYTADEEYITEFDAGFYPKITAIFEADSLANLNLGLADLTSIAFDWNGYDIPVFAFNLITDADGGIVSILGLERNGDFQFGHSGTLSWTQAMLCCEAIYTSRGKWKLTNLDLPPVPLPASAPLLLAGLAGLALFRRAGSR